MQSLYANDLKLLKKLEDSLGVKVTTREGWVKLEGEPAASRPRRSASSINWNRRDRKRRRYPETRIQLRPQFGERSTRRQSRMTLSRPKIVTSSRKPPIVARTVGQRNYVEAIQKHDVVFGIGPAGTGKTYLAVAMAVAALKKEQVSTDHSDPPRGGSRRGARIFARAICRKKSRRICARSTMRCATCSSRRKWSAHCRAQDDRSRAARLHARPHPEQRLRHSR